MSVSVYCAGNVDNNTDRLAYYDLINDLINKDQNVTLFMPGRAFTPIGDVDPDYIVDVNRLALERANIVVVYINGIPTVGTWLEVSWCIDNKNKLHQSVILCADADVKISVYMKWVAKQFNTRWITNYRELGNILNNKIVQINAENFIELTEEFTLGESLNICEGGEFNEQ